MKDETRTWLSSAVRKIKFEERHVLFQKEDKATYIGKRLKMAVK